MLKAMRSILLFAATLAMTTTLDAQNKPAAKSLTPQDYMEIQQLSARYAFAIDTCTNGGADFADLFVDDGEFSVSREWGVPGNRPTKGRAGLIRAAGGDGQGGCVDAKTTMGYGISHLIVNLVITRTADGATGRSYLLAIGVGGDPTKIERQGGYDDLYVKTPAGWRFKRRVHVFPNISESVQFGRRGRAQ
jgi:hypothetical protein